MENTKRHLSVKMDDASLFRTFIYSSKKVKSSDISHIDEIDEKDYPLKYSTDSRKLFKIGVNFFSEKPRIEEWAN